jgi:hypothetical protein
MSTGVWLIGARRLGRHTVIGGAAAAVRAGLAPPTGYVAEQAEFAGAGRLPALGELVHLTAFHQGDLAFAHLHPEGAPPAAPADLRRAAAQARRLPALHAVPGRRAAAHRRDRQSRSSHPHGVAVAAPASTPLPDPPSHQLVGCDGQVADALAGGVEDRVRDGGARAGDAELTDAAPRRPRRSTCRWY